MPARRFHSILLAALAIAPLGLAQDPYPVTGVPVSDSKNGVPLRRNINDLQAAGGAQWDLYIRSLLEMQQANYTDPLSYFQVEGIHGRPFIEWNGTGGQQTSGWAGYCPHGEELFVSWHRPYVLLFEQVLVSHAKQLAQSYPEKLRAEYTQAADQLRSPFWDWAAGSTVPQSTVPAKITVNVPNGQGLQAQEVDNPLYTYKIPQPVLDGRYGTFDPQNRPQTVRCPAPQSYPASANELLAERPYRQWVYDLFTRSTNFSEFATTSNSIVSLELIHNGIHWDAACGEQFLSPDLSAFDPLFMLHHSNVDRLWSYWQAIKPDQDIFHDSYSGQSRFASPSGTTINSKSPLQPFFGRNRTPHTTESVRGIQGFGYSYEGLEYWTKSADQMKQDATRLINRLYSGQSAPRSRRQEPQTKNRYFARISVDRAELPKPCQIKLLLNGKEIAGVVVMGLPATGKIAAGLPLDRAMQGSKMSEMKHEDATSSIASSLSAKVIKADGSTADDVKSLKVELEDVTVSPPPSEDAFPKYGPSKFHNVANSLLFVPAVIAAPVASSGPSFILDYSETALTFNYSTPTPDATNWIGLFSSVRLSVPSLKPGTYTAYFLAKDGYVKITEQIDLRFNGFGPVKFIVDEFTTHNAREGDKFEAKIGGLIGVSPDANNKFRIVSSTNSNWATISANGVISGVPRYQGRSVMTVEATGSDGSKARIVVRVPVQRKHAQLVEKLTVLSFNLWHGGTQVNDYHNKQIRFLTSSGADVVGVQESQRGNVRRLAYALGWYFWETRDIGIISRYPITQQYPDTSAAGSVRISLDGTDTEVVMWNTHLGYDPYGPYDFCFSNMTRDQVLKREEESGRTPQITEIVNGMKEELENADKVALLLMGDFNAPSHLDWINATRDAHCDVGSFPWPSSVMPVEAGLIDSYRKAHDNPVATPGITWSPIYKDNEGRKEPMDRLDFIYYKGFLEVLSSEVVLVGKPQEEPNHQDNEWTSDHAAVKTVFNVKKR
ncbi:endonuclease/exonuclease/phosphatase family [Purpureocillium lavendulum]|uniref:Endonuclease/exonuclease/phosphatase family n=1 Tax=Purpureocillium lavendulum TaxID=1247861 RepID=A0AB34G4U9_9HYPO|nr:endonuclease/exonuclease/phosphatase family [Purpureocillium lavendulum]